MSRAARQLSGLRHLRQPLRRLNSVALLLGGNSKTKTTPLTRASTQLFTQVRSQNLAVVTRSGARRGANRFIGRAATGSGTDRDRRGDEVGDRVEDVLHRGQPHRRLGHVRRSGGSAKVTAGSPSTREYHGRLSQRPCSRQTPSSARATARPGTASPTRHPRPLARGRHRRAQPLRRLNRGIVIDFAVGTSRAGNTLISCARGGTSTISMRTHRRPLISNELRAEPATRLSSGQRALNIVECRRPTTTVSRQPRRSSEDRPPIARSN